MELSPSAVAPVCQDGDQLELMCNVAGAFLRWEFTVTFEDGTPMTFMPVVTPDGVPPPRMVNLTTFTFSRLSAQYDSPLMSRLTINPVSEGLNGVRVNCEDVEASESATTTIQIIDAGGRKIIIRVILTHFNFGLSF